MTIDLTKLDADLRRAKSARRVDTGPGGRRRTGAMDIVRKHLVDLERRHDGGATWVETAAALANQGVVQGDRDPITGRRLTALIASVRRQEARRAAIEQRRKDRADVSLPKRTHSLLLSAELAASRAEHGGPSSAELENAIRREAFERHENLIKKDGAK